jgi:hypothetical protein
MSKIYKFIEAGYLIIAIFLMVETFLNWKTEPQKAYLYLAFSLLAIFMYLFKKNFRKRIDKRNKDNK